MKDERSPKHKPSSLSANPIIVRALAVLADDESSSRSSSSSSSSSSGTDKSLRTYGNAGTSLSKINHISKRHRPDVESKNAGASLNPSKKRKSDATNVDEKSEPIAMNLGKINTANSVPAKAIHDDKNATSSCKDATKSTGDVGTCSDKVNETEVRFQSPEDATDSIDNSIGEVEKNSEDASLLKRNRKNVSTSYIIDSSNATREYGGRCGSDIGNCLPQSNQYQVDTSFPTYSPDDTDTEVYHATEREVIPYSTGSFYGDPLSLFLSIPFHSKAIDSFHQAKKKTVHPRVRVDKLPILCQKEYLQIMRNDDDNEQCENERQKSIATFGEVIDNENSTGIVAGVSKFLLEECQKLIESPVSSLENSEDEDSFAPHQQSKSSKPSHATNAHSAHRVNPSSQNAQPPNSQCKYMLARNHQNHPHYGHKFIPPGKSVYYNNYSHSMHCAPVYAPVQKSFPTIYPHNFAATSSSATHAFNANHHSGNESHASKESHNDKKQNANDRHHHNSNKIQNNNSHAPNTRNQNIIGAIASSRKVVSQNDVGNLKKLPLAFSFFLDDGGVSKKSALKASKQWEKEGTSLLPKLPEKATTSSFKRYGNVPKPAMPSNSTSRICTPEERKRNIVPTDTNTDFDIPHGWTVKTHVRLSGSHAGQSYRTFHSPQKNFAFRSLKKVRIFEAILSEPGISGDETAAMKAFKSRGHKR